MRSTLFALASIFGFFGIVVACTQDFDTFKGAAEDGGTASGSSGGAASSTSGGGSSTSGGSGGTSTSGSSSGSSGVDAAPVDCQAISGSCFDQANTCNAKCQADHTACTTPCPNGNPGKACRQDCDNKQTACLAPCKMTCEQCAGPQCRAKCP